MKQIAKLLILSLIAAAAPVRAESEEAPKGTLRFTITATPTVPGDTTAKSVRFALASAASVFIDKKWRFAAAKSGAKGNAIGIILTLPDVSETEAAKWSESKMRSMFIVNLARLEVTRSFESDADKKKRTALFVSDLQFTAKCAEGKNCASNSFTADGYEIDVKRSGAMRLLTVRGEDGAKVDPTKIAEIAKKIQGNIRDGWVVSPLVKGASKLAKRKAPNVELDKITRNEKPADDAVVVKGEPKRYVFDDKGFLVSVDGKPIPPGVQAPTREGVAKEIPVPAGLKAYDGDEKLREFQKSLVEGDSKVAGLSEDHARAAWMLKQVGWKKRTYLSAAAARDALKGIDTAWAKKMRKASNRALKKMLRDEGVRDKLAGHYMRYIDSYIAKRLKKKGLDFEKMYGPADRARILAAAYTEGMGRVSRKIIKGGEGYEYSATTKAAKQVVAAFDKTQKGLAAALPWGTTVKGLREKREAAIVQKFDAETAAFAAKYAAPKGDVVSLPKAFKGYAPPKKYGPVETHAVHKGYSRTFKRLRNNAVANIYRPGERKPEAIALPGSRAKTKALVDKTHVVTTPGEKAQVVYFTADRAKAMGLKEGDFVSVIYYTKDGYKATTAQYKPKAGETAGPGVSLPLHATLNATPTNVVFIGHPDSAITSGGKAWTPGNDALMQSLGAHLYKSLGFDGPVVARR
jgi:hypothetical protein